MGIRIYFISTVVLTGICYILNPDFIFLEIQSRFLRITIELLFYTSMVTAIVLGLVLVKNKSYNRIVNVLGIILILLVTAYGFLHVALVKGFTFEDEEIYVNQISGQKIFYQYFDVGICDGPSRTIEKTKITKDFYFIKNIKPDRGIWNVWDCSGKYLRTDTLE